MLDNANIIAQRDPGNTLGAINDLPLQARYDVVLEGGFLSRACRQVVLAGMGGSALAADMVRVLTVGWLGVPLEVVKGYELPAYIGPETLVITISHSGNTEETLSCYQQARQAGAMVAALATGGALLDQAVADGVPYIRVPAGSQPRMSTVYHLRGLLKLLVSSKVIDQQLYDEVAASADWLRDEVAAWASTIPERDNLAKQLAQHMVGKTQVFYGGELTWPLAYKWKISCNESAKNVAFWNRYPECNHNEFIGWSSHPIEKPFAVLDIRSHLERPRIIERMELSDRLLSGQRPKAQVITLCGETLLQQFLWGLALADMASIYTGILNGVDPEPVALVERLKKELS